MTAAVGLLTGSLPFAGMADNPAHRLLPRFDGQVVNGIRIAALALDSDLAALPAVLSDAIARFRPAFVVSLGLALGAPVLKLETTAINRLSFTVPDNRGARPTDGRPIEPDGPAARLATWPAHELAAALLDAGLPAIVSHFAGTHICNATLYTALGAMQEHGLDGPVGFLHLPCLPGQVAAFLKDAPPQGETAPLRPRDLPSMSQADQERALEILLAIVAGRAGS
jgi:pyroglutamyl-peptidase